MKLVLPSSLLAFLAVRIGHVYANTEIVNFVAPKTTEEVEVVGWPVLSQEHSEAIWSIQALELNSPCTQEQACMGDIWVALDLGNPAWKEKEKFTLRLSWATSTPADFYIYVGDELPPPIPTANASLSNLLTSHPQFISARHTYARIRAVKTGILTPGVDASGDDFVQTGMLPFVLVLEPLHYGFLPASVAPVIVLLLPLLFITFIMIVPRVDNHLREIVQRARQARVRAVLGEAHKTQ